MPRILISAGEPSGDLHGAAVARALRARWPNVELYGLGGARMAAEGVRLLAHVDDLAVMGFVEVGSRLPYFIRLLKRVRSGLRSEPPSLVLPIDYPGFNIRLARAAKAAGVPVLYYIAPQVWAWHRSRIPELVRVTDALAVILPFEAEIFEQAGGRAVFVGHPLLDRPVPGDDRAAFLERLGLDRERPLLALFPGSRAQEVERHGRLFAETARRVRGVLPEVQVAIGLGAAVARDTIEALGLPFTEDGWSLLHHARAALVKSGTGTLESALAGTPMAIAYRMHPLTYALARRVVRVDHVGLVNLVAGSRIVPEFIQHEATPDNLTAALVRIIADGPDRDRALADLARVRSSLEPPEPPRPTAERVVDLAAELLESRSSMVRPRPDGRS